MTTMATKKKSAFRKWLEKQPRADLTYRDDIPEKDKVGWHTEEFAEEARKRGVDIRVGTAFAWCSGTRPRYIARTALVEVFPNITF